jgi:hypothetical protein
VSRLTKTEEKWRFLHFSVLHPPHIGGGLVGGGCLFASFSAPEKVRVVANEKNNLLFCKFVCRIEKKSLSLHCQIETGI